MDRLPARAVGAVVVEVAEEGENRRPNAGRAKIVTTARAM